MRRMSTFVWMVAGELIGVILGITINVATGIIPQALQPYLWVAWLVILPLTLLLGWHRERGAARETRSEADGDLLLRERREILRKVRRTWISGFLDHAYEQRLDIGLIDDPGAAARPWNPLVQELGPAASRLPAGTRPVEVFSRFGGRFLILGEPGTGKTTLLLEIAKGLLEEEGDDRPIPVVFHLGSWTRGTRSLGDWLRDELTGERYKVHPDAAAAWLKRNAIVPLLDGLDEVMPELRAACASQINEYIRHSGAVPLVICSRTADYAALGIKLDLDDAVRLEPLSREQIASFLEHLGEPLDGIRTAIASDPVLWDLVRTPLMLHVAVAAYSGVAVVAPPDHATVRTWRAKLFDDYLHRMFGRRRLRSEYTEATSLRWLIYLARDLARGRNLVFSIGAQAGEWLPGSGRRRFLSVTGASIGGLTFGSFVGALGWAFLGPVLSLILGAAAGLLIACVAVRDGLLGVPLPTPARPVPPGMTPDDLPLIAGSVAVLGVAGGVVGLVAGLFDGDVLATAMRGVAGGLIVAVAVFFGEDQVESVKRHFGGAPYAIGEIPHQETSCRPGLLLRRFARLFTVGALGVTALLTPVLGWSGIAVGVLFGLTLGYWRAGINLFHHYLVHGLLAVAGLVPFRYERFLVFACDRIIMRDVDDGYVFIHRLLLEHLARQGIAEDGRRGFDGLRPVDLDPAEASRSCFDLLDRGDVAGVRSCFLWAVDYDESQVRLAEAVMLGERLLRLVPDRRGRENVISGGAGLRFRRFTATETARTAEIVLEWAAAHDSPEAEALLVRLRALDLDALDRSLVSAPLDDL
ncbi:hypothetical protein GCM10023195_08290 [Actinoallomurus liliacearum]|uniref:NACHT domain-containing protein n=1 Tax=Actinoallomurus liliacearum TaxID=1080073 RepID=A0ABP8TEH3_9ACTN